MFDHIGIRVRNLPASTAFYAQVLAPLGHVQGYSDETVVGFGPAGAAQLWLHQSETVAATGAHVAFRAPSREAVQRFYEAALKAGGRDNGPPGPRPSYGESYYAAFVIDIDGNNIEAMLS